MTVRGRAEDEAGGEALAAVGPTAGTCADVTLLTTSARLLSTRMSPAQPAGLVSGLRHNNPKRRDFGKFQASGASLMWHEVGKRPVGSLWRNRDRI